VPPKLAKNKNSTDFEFKEIIKDHVLPDERRRDAYKKVTPAFLKKSRRF